jgi:hypothetical protein
MDLNKLALDVLTVFITATLPFVWAWIRAWIKEHMHGLWQAWALEIVSKIEAESEGAINAGPEKRDAAVAALVGKGVPPSQATALVEWAVAEMADKFDNMTAKRECRKVSE